MSLRLKTILGIATIEAVLLAILLSLTLNYLETTNHRGLDERATSTSTLFATSVKNAVLSYDLATIEAFTTELQRSPDIVYVAVFGDNNQALSTKGDVPESLDDALLRFHNHEETQSIYHIKADIVSSDITFGSVWIGFDLSYLNQQIEDAQHWSALIVFGEMSLVALFSYFLGAYLTRRLSELRKAADDIAQGKRYISLSTHGEDELATVSKAFEQMVESLRQSEDENQQYQQQLLSTNESLEVKVAARTQDLMRSNQELRQTNHQLKTTQAKLVETEKMASIGTMAAGVAHEINNPIAAVKSNLQSCFEYLSTYQQWVSHSESLIGQQYHDKQKAEFERWKKNQHVEFLYEDFKDSLNDAQMCVTRVARIVSALQNYSQYQNENDRTFSHIELFDVIDKALNQIPLSLNVQIILDASINKQPAVVGVYDELKTLFEQVIKNAIQACDRAAPKLNHCVKVTASHSQHSVNIVIEDTGAGIPQDAASRIYDPFYTTLPVGEGMGLGLTYVYDIVHLHQGDINIQSSPDGTKVTIVLPVAERYSGSISTG